MKKLEIEELEKKMPYDVPEAFFGEMQRNVFQKVAEEKQPLRKNLKSIWAVAAAFALLLGMGILFLNESKDSDTAIASTEKTIIDSTFKMEPNHEVAQSKPVTEEVSVENPTIAKRNDMGATTPNSATGTQVASRDHHPAKAQFTTAETRLDNAVNQLNNQELAELSAKYEIDTYLELY